MDATFIGLTVAGLLTLGIFSFLYKDNPVYRMCEAVFVGVSAGYWAVVYFFDNIHKKFYEGVFPSEGMETQMWLWGGGILGILMLFRISSKIGWIARWPLSFIVGATAGLYMMIYFVTNAMNQVSNTIQSFLVFGADGSLLWADSIGATVIIVGVFSGLVYFFFSKEHKGVFGGVARVGVWTLMITFGASFGYTVMSRMSLLIGRMDFIFGDWFRLY